MSRGYKSSSKEPEGSVKDYAASPRSVFDKPSQTADRIRPKVFRTPEQLARRQRLSEAAAKSTYAQWKRAEDRRRFHPAGKDAQPSNIFGASAEFNNRAKNAPKFFAEALPCIDRVVRRQVMFALNRAGKGHRKPKRRTWRSLIPC